MRALVIGSGGRENALAWALAASRHVSETVVAPGNPGTARLAATRSVDLDDPTSIVRVARAVDAGLVVVGPEGPLVGGAGDALRAAGFRVFGPDAAAARIEGSKSYAKELMARAGIPAARGRAFVSPAGAAAHLDRLGPPYVVKADGLAGGKGVVVTADRAEAMEAVEDRLVRGVFGEAGRTVVIEEYLEGPEVSLIAITDGATVIPCEPAQDHKRVHDGDRGANTGGMGAYSPVPVCPDELALRISDEVLYPMVGATAATGCRFVGALYAGLVLTPEGPRVLEFNARWGDPETQALIPRLESDFGELCLACASGQLEGMKPAWRSGACVSVVLASGGYPSSHRTGLPIEGLEAAEALPDTWIFHAGTASRGDGLVTAGGRVLAVSALGATFAGARTRAYEAADLIRFEGMHFRRDIAARAEAMER